MIAPHVGTSCSNMGFYFENNILAGISKRLCQFFNAQNKTCKLLILSLHTKFTQNLHKHRILTTITFYNLVVE